MEEDEKFTIVCVIIKAFRSYFIDRLGSEFDAFMLPRNVLHTLELIFDVQVSNILFSGLALMFHVYEVIKLFMTLLVVNNLFSNQ
jgi:hypothetical protein